jgi:superfamily II DNA or RNA helicase
VSALALRDYQLEALDAIEASLARGKKPILNLPTGGGKTLPAIVKISNVVRAGGRGLFLVHRDELKNQARDQFTRWAPDIRVGILKADQREYDALVVIASIQTAWRPQHLAKLGTDFQIAVVDECHHATATTWRTIIEALKNVPLFGLTATPFRADGSALKDIFDEVAYSKGIIEMIRPDANGNTYLCDIRCERIRIQADFSKLRTVGDDVNLRQAGQMLLDADAPAEIVSSYKQHAMGRKTLVFTPTIAVAEVIAETFRKAGITSEAISDGCSSEEREGIIARLRSGETSVVTNCAILTEGFDCPDVSCVIIARPTRSRVLYIQMLGRGTRKAAGKENLLLLDTVGASERHDLHTLDSLFGVGGIRPDESVLEATERVLAEREAAALAAEERGKLISQRITLMRQQELHWAKAPAGDLFVLSLGSDHGNIRIVRDRENWLIIRKLGAGDGYQEEIIGTSNDLVDATAMAEASLDARARNSALTDPNHVWRNRPIEISSKMLKQADKFKLRYVLGRTPKGELSDQITIAYARISEDFRTGRRRQRYVPSWVRR